jgi:hypothetical protein
MVFPSAKTYINGHNKRPHGGPLVPPAPRITTHTKVRLSVNPVSNTRQVEATTMILLYHCHPRYGASGCQTSILPALHPSHKIPESTCHRPIIHGPHMQHDTYDRNYERHLLVHKKGDVSIAIGAFADMDCLPEFDKMVAHPALRIPQKIPVDEDTILPYFPNLIEAVPGEFNAIPFIMAHKIPFHELQARVELYIWSHSIKISPNKSDPDDTPNDTFCNSQIILSQNYMSKPTKEENDASLLAMENHQFDCLMDAMQDQYQAMYAFVDLHVHHFSNSCDNAQSLYTSVADSISNHPRLNKPTIQETPDGNEISSNSPRLDL